MSKKKANGEGSICKRSDGRYMARYTVDGKRKAIYGTTHEEVRTKLNEILNEMKRTNANTSKSLELLQIAMENQTEMLKRHDEHFNDGLKVLVKDVQSISSRLGRMKE